MVDGQYVIGLTGGIGSGKTTVSNLFDALGVAVVDTDIISREVVEPGQPALLEIANTFGDNLLTDSGGLDRSALRTLVFADESKRRRLETILHPAIRDRALNQAANSVGEYCILVVPLLFETGFDQLTDRNLVVDSKAEDQIARVISRDQIDIGQVRQIMASQLPRLERLKRADDVIENFAESSTLNEAVARLNVKYRQLARFARSG